MQKICAVSGVEFEITPQDLEFYEKIGLITQDDLRGLPTLCPDERALRRMTWVNHRHLYHRTCAGTGKKIISNFAPESAMKIFHIHFWFSDGWDQLATGRDFDFTRPFFEQFNELLKEAPIPSLQRSPEYDENSEFTNYAGKNKNCYLIFDSDKNRDSYLSYSLNKCENVVDSFRMSDSELAYECIDSTKIYNAFFLQDCDNCSDSWFLKSCIGCKDCFGCVNLRNKQYYFLNESCTKEAYFEKLKSLGLEKGTSLQNMRQQFLDFAQKLPHKFIHGVQNEDVRGDYLTQCKNAIDCFDSRKLWDCKYIQQSFDDVKNSMDCTEVGDGAEWLYECDCMGYVANSNKFCTHQLGQTSNLTYCYFTPYCSDCFGCVGLNHKKFCIFNKQYTEEEYKRLVPKIVAHMKKTGEWGEFFPAHMSPFAYNETHAFDYFPLGKEAVLGRGLRWREDVLGGASLAQYEGPAYEIPDTIEAVSDDICDKILTCEATGKNYRIVQPELAFYRKMNLPIPRICPDERHRRRMALRNPRNLWDRKCDKCGVDIQTTFSPNRPERVYCEKCYNEAVD